MHPPRGQGRAGSDKASLLLCLTILSTADGILHEMCLNDVIAMMQTLSRFPPPIASRVTACKLQLCPSREPGFPQVG